MLSVRVLHHSASMQCPPTQMLRRNARLDRAFTFVDVMGAALLTAVFLCGAFLANSRGLNMLRTSRETAISSKILQERMEQLRGFTWTDITDSDILRTNFGTATDSASGLAPTLSETLTVTSWPTAGTAIKITRSTTGVIALVTDNVDLVDGADAVLVTVRADWIGANNRNRSRETCTIMANGGLGR